MNGRPSLDMGKCLGDYLGVIREYPHSAPHPTSNGQHVHHSQCDPEV